MVDPNELDALMSYGTTCPESLNMQNEWKKLVEIELLEYLSFASKIKILKCLSLLIICKKIFNPFHCLRNTPGCLNVTPRIALELILPSKQCSRAFLRSPYSTRFINL